MDFSDPITLGFVAVALIALIFVLLPNKGEGALASRLKRARGEAQKPEKTKDSAAPKVQLKREMKDSGIPLLDRVIKAALPNPDKVRQRLAATGAGLSISEYLLITALAVAVFVFIFRALVGMKLLGAVFLGLALGLWLPHTVTGMMARSRSKKFIKFFPESIDAMVRGIRSGLPVSESINTVAEEMPDPIGKEFRTIRDSVRMGVPLETAMWDVAKRIDVPEYRYLIIALSIQRETGGNLAETLANVSDVLRKRRQMKLKIKAMSSEAKASAMILGALPFIMILVLGAVSPDYIGTLFNDPRGNILLGIAGSIMGLGIFIMAQMINFDF